MKKTLFFFLVCVNFLSAQSSLINVTNFCGTQNISGNIINYTGFAQIGDFLLIRSPGGCYLPDNSSTFSVWAYNGTASPYKIKFPDGSDFNSLGTLTYNDIVKVGERVYLNCDSAENSKDGLYFFDPAISTTHLSKVITDNFPADCKEFKNLAKFNNGIIYESFVNDNCFYNPGSNSSNFLFHDFRDGNFAYGSVRFFSNSDFNGNFYYTTISDTVNSPLIKKYNPSSNTTEVITSSPYPNNPYPSSQIIFSNKLYYINKNNNAGVELFQFDGTSETCIDINPGTASSYPNLLTIVNNKMYFTCFYNNKYYLYKYDGNTPPEIIHESTYNSVDYYSGLCEFNNTLYITKTYQYNASGQFNTELYRYSENTNALLLVNTFFNFFTTVAASPLITYTAPQFYENKRGHLISFKNELYIVGHKLNNSNQRIGAHNDIWKIGNSSLQTEENNLSTIQYYPNPTKNDLNIDFEKNHKSIEINVIGINGQIITNQKFYNSKKIEIKLPKSSGIYYISLTYDDKKNTIKIIKE
ncbi:T9SS type A sorting domain-containing protein [Chryseobacterium sp. RU33C]|uniref:T9SS type A sorting domain-containing protein n=1 Tax=Chryseobacterium sp. RU33C TaxID=1907398 RepID=UPI00095426CB|nr:T9SS type A sorting domain-containing protein [Chryseobacterium sp. RU33C]SIR53852.1 Por secretion system C-terminal sorting domain-containing protein [Chryseobacterium sp. RU33C]